MPSQRFPTGRTTGKVSQPDTTNSGRSGFTGLWGLTYRIAASNLITCGEITGFLTGIPSMAGTNARRSKVSYRLLEPEQHQHQNIVVVGGGDSAIEAAIALGSQPGNKVILSYRGEALSRIKPMNKERLDDMVAKKCVTIMFQSNIREIGEKEIKIST